MRNYFYFTDRSFFIFYYFYFVPRAGACFSKQLSKNLGLKSPFLSAKVYSYSVSQNLKLKSKIRHETGPVIWREGVTSNPLLKSEQKFFFFFFFFFFVFLISDFSFSDEV